MGGKRRRQAVSQEEQEEMLDVDEQAVAVYENGVASGREVEGDACGAVEKPVGLQIYWNLSLRDEKAREEASVALVKELTLAQQGWEGSRKGKHKAVQEEVLGASSDEVLLAGCAPDVRYALRRLVRGLSSSRETVRQGFASALAAVLGALTCVGGEAVLNLVKKNLEAASSMKGQEARHVLLGRLFAYGALIRGFRERTMSVELAQEITQLLLSLAARKIYLREPSVSLLLEFSESLPTDILRKGVFSAPLFQEWIQAKPDGASPDTLVMALRLFPRLPAPARASCALVSGSEDLKQVLSPAHLSCLVPILKETTCSLPRVHSLWPVFLELLLSGNNVGVPEGKRKKKKASNVGQELETRLKNFWEIVVEEGLLTSSHERKHLAMELLLLLLPRLSPSLIRIVLTGPIVRCLSDVLSGQQTWLHKAAQRCLQEICEWAQQDDERIIEVIISLQRCTSGKFDVKSGTQTVKTLVSKLSGERSWRTLITRLFECFVQGSRGAHEHEGTSVGVGGIKDSGSSEHNTKEDVKDGQDGGEELITEDHSGLDTAKVWVIEQLLLVFKVAELEPVVRSSLQKDFLRFLALHGLFQASAPMDRAITEEGEKLEFPEGAISNLVRSMCVTRLCTLLVDTKRSVLLKHKHINQGNEADRGNVDSSETEDLLGFVVDFLSRVQKIENVSFVRPLSKETKMALTGLHAALVQVSKALSTCDRESAAKLRAMRLFLVQLIFQIYVEPDAPSDIVAELLLCCQYLLGQHFEVPVAVVPVDNDELPHTMDVLVDILLSVLIQPSARLRAGAEQLFKVFCRDLTANGLKAILRVVRKQPKAARFRPAFEVEEDSDEDEVVDIDNDSDVEEEESKSDHVEDDEEEDCESDDEDEEEGVVNNGDKCRVKKQVADVLKVPEVEEKRGRNANANETASKSHSDDEDGNLSDMDDEQMFAMDFHLSKILQQKKAGGDGSQSNKDVQSQLTDFKLRALSLLEIFLLKNSSSPLVFPILRTLLQQFVIASGDGNAELIGRIGDIIKGKILKAKQYPTGPDVSKSVVKELLPKTISVAARSLNKEVRNIAQLSVFWLLKVLNGNWSRSELQNDTDLRHIFSGSLQDFFVNRKLRLQATFFSEILVRYPWQGEFFVTVLLQQCKSARTAFLQCRALQLLALYVKTTKRTKGAPLVAGSLAAALEPHLKMLGEALVALFQKPPDKASTRKEAYGYCVFCLESLPKVYFNLRLVDVVDVPMLLAAIKALDAPRLKRLEYLLEDSLDDIEDIGQPQSVVTQESADSLSTGIQEDGQESADIQEKGHPQPVDAQENGHSTPSRLKKTKRRNGAAQDSGRLRKAKRNG